MKPWISWTLNGLGLGLVAMLTANAGWLANAPKGYMKLIAERGTAQQFDPKAGASGGCTATRIEKPVHDFIENTITGLQQADRLGANVVQVDVALTGDGRFVLYSDAALDCRTEGSGTVRQTALDAIQQLDPGAGYSADGGKTFPLNGLQTSRIPALETALASLPDTPILFKLASRDPGDGAKLAAALKAAGRDVVKKGDGFYADEAVLAPLRAAFPKVWAFSPTSAAECTSRYRLIGWLTLVPDACKNGTLFIPLDAKWTFPGWPDRLQARMKAANVRIVLTAPGGTSTAPMGLDLPEQMAEIPPSYTGYVWVRDIWTMGPTLHPATRRRSPEAEVKLDEALTARRKARGLPEPQ